MNKSKRPSLRAEELESRTTPALTRAIGTLQVVDTTLNPNYSCTSLPAGNVSGRVAGTDVLSATLSVTYTLTGTELTKATTGGGLTQKWRMVIL